MFLHDSVRASHDHGRVTRSLAPHEPSIRTSHTSTREPAGARLLTELELTVLQLTARGYAASQVATILGMPLMDEAVLLGPLGAALGTPAEWVACAERARWHGLIV